MKKTLIYDANCPMCRAYTAGFVRLGLLDAQQRLASHAVTDPALLARIDPHRACHEIPLVDPAGGETHYGVDALANVVGQRWRGLGRLLTWSPVRWLLRGLYAFISYNRRIIVPAPPTRWSLLDLAPTFHAGYRLLLLALVYGGLIGLHTWATGSWPLWPLALLAGQWLLAGLVIRRVFTRGRPDAWLDYVAHLGVSLLLGAGLTVLGLQTGQRWLVLLANAVTIWQHTIRLRALQLPDALGLSFAFILLLIMTL